jgi:hypothetical protein
MQYLAELVQHGLGISILPPASVRAVTAHVATIPITPPLRRDICAVTAATYRPPAPPKPSSTSSPPTSAADAVKPLTASANDPGG